MTTKDPREELRRRAEAARKWLEERAAEGDEKAIRTLKELDGKAQRIVVNPKPWCETEPEDAE